MNETKVKILEAVLDEFKAKGSKFTMDDVAGDLHMSKKTIYKEFDDKEKIFDALVDYCFDSIKQKEQEIETLEAEISAKDEILATGAAQTPDFYKEYQSLKRVKALVKQRLSAIPLRIQ